MDGDPAEGGDPAGRDAAGVGAEEHPAEDRGPAGGGEGGVVGGVEREGGGIGPLNEEADDGRPAPSAAPTTGTATRLSTQTHVPA